LFRLIHCSFHNSFLFRSWILFIGLLISCSHCQASDQDCLSRKLEPVDASGDALDTYCVVPLYAKSSGVRVGPEGQGGAHDPAYYLRWITEKTRDEEFACIKEKREKGIVMPFLPFGIAVGESIGPVRNMLYLKRGFAPFIKTGWTDGRVVTKLTMPDGISEDVVQHLLSGEIDQDRIRDIYKLPKNQKIVDEFTEEEREKLRKCYFGEGTTK